MRSTSSVMSEPSTRRSSRSARPSPTWCCSTCTCPTVVGRAILEGLADGLPDTKCLALSVSDAADDVIGVIRAGARGYVTKTITREELLDAIRRVHAGDAVFSPRLAGFVLDAFAGSAPVTSDPDMDRLTQREQEVLRLIARGLHLQRGRRAHPRLGEDRRDARVVGASQAAAVEPPRAHRVGDRSPPAVEVSRGNSSSVCGSYSRGQVAAVDRSCERRNVQPVLVLTRTDRRDEVVRQSPPAPLRDPSYLTLRVGRVDVGLAVVV